MNSVFGLLLLFIFFVLTLCQNALDSGEAFENNEENVEDPLFIKDIIDGLKEIKKQLTPTAKDINLLLYRPKSKSKWETIANGNSTSNINTVDLKSGKDFKITIHGFLSSCNSSDFSELVFKEYIKNKGDYNYLCVDWGPLANPGTITQIASLFHYPKAVNNTFLVGDVLEKLLTTLIRQNFINRTSSIHLIGHSLGCHISGVAGHELFARMKKKIGRITGLDPAGPFFYEKGSDSKAKLGASDAKFVDIIHTNMGQLGTNEYLGHLRFIPNGGRKQPFCLTGEFLKDVAEKLSGYCSHISSVKMFANSIGNKIKACQCDSWEKYSNSNKSCPSSNAVLFGDRVDQKMRGTFCLTIK